MESKPRTEWRRVRADGRRAGFPRRALRVVGRKMRAGELRQVLVKKRLPKIERSNKTGASQQTKQLI